MDFRVIGIPPPQSNTTHVRYTHDKKGYDVRYKSETRCTVCGSSYDLVYANNDGYLCFNHLDSVRDDWVLKKWTENDGF